MITSYLVVQGTQLYDIPALLTAQVVWESSKRHGKVQDTPILCGPGTARSELFLFFLSFFFSFLFFFLSFFLSFSFLLSFFLFLSFFLSF